MFPDMGTVAAARVSRAIHGATRKIASSRLHGGHPTHSSAFGERDSPIGGFEVGLRN